MEYGISKLSIIPGRAEPSDKAENITQILFGEHYTIIDSNEKWLKVELAHDQYQCWIDKKQHTGMSKEQFDLLESIENPRTLDLLGIAKDNVHNTYHNIPMGSQLPFFDDGEFSIEDSEFRFKGNLAVQEKDNLIPYAHLYLHAPYLWGGRTPFGIDCSGFAQMCYKLIGIQIPRDAYQQAEIGEELASIEDTQLGDLVFFDNEDKKITHVGLMISKDEVIHASGRVRIEKIDKRGIYNVDLKGYSHSLCKIKRVLE